MPEKMEKALKEEASKHKGWSDEHKDRYVYGAMRATGWKPKREQHGSLEDITFMEEADSSMGDELCPEFVHPIHKGYKSITWSALDPPQIDGNDPEPFEKGKQSANRDAGQGLHYGAPIDYFGPDTDYRAEEIDVHQYGRDHDPIPYRDYFKTEDKMAERTFRVREQDEYDQTPQPGTVTDEQPMSEAYGAVNYKGAGP